MSIEEDQEQQQLKASDLLMEHIRRTLKRTSDPNYPNPQTVGMLFEQTYAVIARKLIRDVGGIMSTEEAYHRIADYHFDPDEPQHFWEDPIVQMKLERIKCFGPNTAALFNRWQSEGFPTDKNQRRLEMQAAKAEDIIKRKEKGKGEGEK